MDMLGCKLCVYPTAQADKNLSVASTATDCCYDVSWRIMVVEYPRRVKVAVDVSGADVIAPAFLTAACVPTSPPFLHSINNGLLITLEADIVTLIDAWCASVYLHAALSCRFGELVFGMQTFLVPCAAAVS